MSTERNPVGWFEIYVKDMDRAKAFYEGVFQTKLEPQAPPEGGPPIQMLAFPMAENASDKPGSPGAIVKMEGVSPGTGGTLVYFSCQDCAEEASRVASSGGTLAQEKFPIGQYGFIAIAKDPDGNTIGLHSTQ